MDKPLPNFRRFGAMQYRVLISHQRDFDFGA